MSIDLKSLGYLDLPYRKCNVKPNKAIQIGNLDIYLCPKCATNTVRYASYKFDGGDLDIPDVRDLTKSDYNILSMGTNSILNYHEERSDSIKVAIKRDPVKRFVSSHAWYNYKYGDIEKTVQKETVDLCLLSIPDDIHFFPQTIFYGDDPAKYDHIIYIDDLRQLIYKETKFDIGTIHKGKADLVYETLNEEQEMKVRKLYKMDYDNGYC